MGRTVKQPRHTELSCEATCISQSVFLPPVAVQVILTLDPSLYGPSIWCRILLPLSSRIVSFSGGTETNNEFIIKISYHLAVLSDIYLIKNSFFLNIYHTKLRLVENIYEYQHA
jgi:hypothetical protein